MSRSRSLPRLDCHAHIAPDVTGPQVAALNGAVIFAMTRSPGEAEAAVRRCDATILWGYGAHPGLKNATAEVTAQGIRQAVTDHVVIGEIGLDRGTGLTAQQAALDTILAACTDQPVLLSVHSTGRTGEVLAALTRRPHRGAILHWFNGTPTEIQRAVDLDCYFSINAAMTDERIASMPRDRLLPETDFPSSRRSTRAKIPGDIDHLEDRLAMSTGQPVEEIRAMWYSNLRDLVRRAGVDARLPNAIQALLQTV